MKTITDELHRVTGGAGPAGDSLPNDLRSWLPQDASQIKPAESRVTSPPNTGGFPQPRTSEVTSGPDRAWTQGLPGMFSAMGM